MYQFCVNEVHMTAGVKQRFPSNQDPSVSNSSERVGRRVRSFRRFSSKEGSGKTNGGGTDDKIPPTLNMSVWLRTCC